MAEIDGRVAVTPFDAMVAYLLGLALPVLDGAPGRRIECADALASPEEIAQAMADGCGPTELAAMAGISRQAAFEQLRRHHKGTHHEPL